MVISIYLSIIPLNVNGLNAAIKNHRVAEWLGKITHLHAAPKILHANRELDKVGFKTKTVERGHIQEEATNIVNIYTSNIGAPKYLKQNLRQKLTVILQ